ncbi:MAG: hypothetical protein QNK64_05715 [Saprospiraceae bacterium]|jgi:hypothetical protein|tara:strand:+ start:733 stop:963 length:231 start_codon:yes stop_codon:yes gene_type:complete
MFTIEMDWDETAITVLDQGGEHEDVQFLIYEDIVYIRQFDNDTNMHTLIEMSPDQFHEIMASMNLPEGAYLMGSGK